MPLVTWQTVLRIISTVLNILIACLNGMGITPATVDEIDNNGHA